MKYLFVILLLIQSSVHSLYHSTDHIITRIKFNCAFIKELTCEWKNDILVVDWLKDKPRDELWVFGEHARERITSEVALNVIHMLNSIKPNKRITIIPVLNIWGRRRVDEGNVCLRKNSNGVDTNRNYQTAEKHRYSENSEEYEGPHPLSEKETQLVSTILNDGVKRYINIHSGEFSMYMPYDSNTRRPPHADRMIKTLKAIQPMCPQCKTGSAGSVSFYKAYGTSVDYAIRVGVPEAYTFEIFGTEATNCDTMFNPKNTSPTVNMWSKILFSMAIDESLSTVQST